MGSRDGSEVEDNGERIAALRILAQKGEDAVGMVEGVDPGKTFRVEIGLPKGRFSQVKLVQVLDEKLHAAMKRTCLEQTPVQFGIGVPLDALGELAAHEQQNFPGKGPLIAEQNPQVGELAPIIARHAAQQGAFAVNY